jgi:medium-chain acyl-[acyl-carrier-protein] hydrolase
MSAPSLVGRPATEWLDFFKPRPAARVRLLCFPYAGGSALVYRDWQNELPDFIEVWPIQLPARGRRVSEPPFRQVGQIVDAIEKELLDRVETPYAIFGYSMGALMAFELARRGDQVGKPPVQIFVGARGAPHLKHGTDTFLLPDDEFIAELRRIQATPEEILSDPDLIQFFLPTVRADFEIAQGYRFTEAPRISCPITAFGGQTDADVLPQHMEPWGMHTNAGHAVHLYPGGHFFLNEAKREVLNTIAAELSKRVRAS